MKSPKIEIYLCSVAFILGSSVLSFEIETVFFPEQTLVLRPKTFLSQSDDTRPVGSGLLIVGHKSISYLQKLVQSNLEPISLPRGHIPGQSAYKGKRVENLRKVKKFHLRIDTILPFVEGTTAKLDCILHRVQRELARHEVSLKSSLTLFLAIVLRQCSFDTRGVLKILYRGIRKINPKINSTFFCLLRRTRPSAAHSPLQDWWNISFSWCAPSPFCTGLHRA